MPHVSKMPIYPKKALKMPDWQHRSLPPPPSPRQNASTPSVAYAIYCVTRPWQAAAGAAVTPPLARKFKKFHAHGFIFFFCRANVRETVVCGQLVSLLIL